jgi:hypothetical protein
MNKIITILLISIFIYKYTYSQHVKDSSIFIPAISAAYSFQIPGGDLATRFGCSSTIGGSFLTKLKSDWVFAVEGSYLFGNILHKEATGVLDNLRTSNGEIINKNGNYSVVLLTERGFYFGAKGGKLIFKGKSNPNSGILITFSGGLLQHKIKIENDGSDTPQILGEKKKGYDKLTNGFALGEFIGYMYFGKKEIANFYAGFEFYQAWTKCRRDFNFDTMQKDTKKRHDYIYSIKIGWIIPFYKRNSEKWYVY